MRKTFSELHPAFLLLPLALFLFAASLIQPATSQGRGFLPFTGNVSQAGPAFSVSNTGRGPAILGKSGGSFGHLGNGFWGAYGKAANGNYGGLGAQEYATYGWHEKSRNYGALGMNAWGAYGQNTNGNLGGLGAATWGAYGQNKSGAFGGLGAANCGVYGVGSFLGVYGRNAIGVFGSLGAGDMGVYGVSPGGYAGRFYGPVSVSGELQASAPSTRIDHPLDPENKYLNHAGVSSDQRINLYKGHVTLDLKGEANITLPEWFSALNGDFDYHLTPIGAPAPDLHIAKEIENNRFQIAGGKPGLKVSWVVYGVRQDAYAKAHPLTVQENKQGGETGFYLHPKEQGKPEDKGIDFHRIRSLEQRP